ncbi:MAG: hypothetical protein Kow0062_18900 [Acidobacteriota bacterium]
MNPRSAATGGSAPASRPRRTFGWLLLGVFVLALVLRVGAVLESRGSPYHDWLVLDAATYHRIAVVGDPREPFWQPPLYPWFLRGVYALAGHPDPLLPRLVQSLFGALVAVIAALHARRLAGTAAGIGAGTAVALTGSLIYFDGELLPASAGCLLLAGAALLVESAGQGSPGQRLLRAAALGTVFGAAALLLPALAFAAAGLLVLYARRDGRARAALVVVLALIPVASVAARNARWEPGFVPVSWNGGINFFIGNNENYPRTVGIRPGIAWNELVERPRCLGHARTRAEESAYFWREGLRLAVRRPVLFARNLLWKAAATLSVREIGRNRDPYAARGESRILAVLLHPAGLPFAVLFAGTAVGLAAAIRVRAVPWVPLVAACGVLLAGVVFFPTARYRAPALPALAVAAAAGLARARWRDVPWAVPALLVGLVPAGIPTIPPWETQLEIGSNLEQWKRPALAERFYRDAAARAPDDADVRLRLGLVLLRLGRPDEAIAELEHAVRLRPDAGLAWRSLGIARRDAGDLSGALEALARAVEVDPCDHRARAFYAQVLMDRGMFVAAGEQLAAARDVHRRRDSVVERAVERWERFTGRKLPPSAGGAGENRPRDR